MSSPTSPDARDAATTTERADSTGPIVRADGVTKRFGATVALDRLTVEIGRGVTGLLGPNGAGKTTLISLVLGLRSRDEGQLAVLGKDPKTAALEMRARIGYAPEHHNLPPDVHAADLVRHLAELHGIPAKAAIQRANDALWHVGLGEERFRPIGTMSTGQRQRVKLASAIAHDPELVLLDEPTNGLDPIQRDDMLALIRRIGTEFGIDIVVSSHQLEEVERICDAVVILDAGVVVRSGRLDRPAGEPWRRARGGRRTGERSSRRCCARQGSRSRATAGPLLVAGRGARTTPCATPSLSSASGYAAWCPRRQTLEDVYLEASR